MIEKETRDINDNCDKNLLEKLQKVIKMRIRYIHIESFISFFYFQIFCVLSTKWRIEMKALG